MGSRVSIDPVKGTKVNEDDYLDQLVSEFYDAKEAEEKYKDIADEIGRQLIKLLGPGASHTLSGTPMAVQVTERVTVYVKRVEAKP